MGWWAAGRCGWEFTDELEAVALQQYALSVVVLPRIYHMPVSAVFSSNIQTTYPVFTKPNQKTSTDIEPIP